MTIDVVLADDEPLVRSGIAMLLGSDSEINVVAEVGNGREAVDAVLRLNPDVVVMDVRMPLMDGVEATRQIAGLDRSGLGPVSVLMLTTYNLDEAIYSALCAGASGFLLKDAAPAELLEAIKSLAGGEGWLDPGITRSLIREFAARAGAMPVPAGKLLELHRAAELATGSPADPPVVTFRHEGEYWTIAYEDEPVHLRDSVGLAYLAILLRNPGREMHALEFSQMNEPPLTSPGSRPTSFSSGSGNAGPLLDDEAKRQYRRRISELQEDLDEAERWADSARAAATREELALVAEELARSLGLGGRDRMAASAAERARVNVTKAIKSTIRKIAKENPALGRHLNNSVRTGTFCSYTPESPSSLTWRF